MRADIFDVDTSDPSEGFWPSVPCVSQATKEDHRSSGLLGSGRNGRQQDDILLPDIHQFHWSHIWAKGKRASSQAKGLLLSDITELPIRINLSPRFINNWHTSLYNFKVYSKLVLIYIYCEMVTIGSANIIISLRYNRKKEENNNGENCSP